MLEEIKEKVLDKENNLSKYATKSIDAIRMNDEKEDVRPSFFHDTDRVIHSLAYTRYLDKTQVFSYDNNDHISKRIVHVTLVSKVARTIGRFLNLNEDLIEAIALGHDIGHTPIGHVGEKILDDISKRELNENFMHNVQSVRTYLCLDNNGKGSNLTLQTLDGILCHNGEMVENIYEPKSKTKEEFLEEYNKCYKDEKVAKKVRPSTLEGCVVRISDIIAYIGRDIEDAINLGVLKRDEVPKQITDILGNTNREIINTVVIDIVNNSYNKPYIKMSKEVFDALVALKRFNYANIYAKANTNETISKYEKMFNTLFSSYLNDLTYNNKDSTIFKVYLDNMSDEYKQNNSDKRIVIDFISGMTDRFFMEEYSKIAND